MLQRARLGVAHSHRGQAMSRSKTSKMKLLSVGSRLLEVRSGQASLVELINKRFLDFERFSSPFTCHGYDSAATGYSRNLHNLSMSVCFLQPASVAVCSTSLHLFSGRVSSLKAWLPRRRHVVWCALIIVEIGKRDIYPYNHTMGHRYIYLHSTII